MKGGEITCTLQFFLMERVRSARAALSWLAVPRGKVEHRGWFQIYTHLDNRVPQS
jgi:hypothetical protein